MASEVDICNMALRAINVKPITVVGSPTSQASVDCALFYPQARDKCLRDHAWNFATTAKELTPFVVPSVWENIYDYAYMYPTDGIKIRKVTQLGQKTGYKYKIVRAPTLEKIILTSIDEAVGEYTMAVVQTTWFDADFVAAAAALLASYLAKPLTGNSKKGLEMLQQYDRAIVAAKVVNAEEDGDQEEDEDSWLASRSLI